MRRDAILHADQEGDSAAVFLGANVAHLAGFTSISAHALPSPDWRRPKMGTDPRLLLQPRTEPDMEMTTRDLIAVVGPLLTAADAFVGWIDTKVVGRL